MSGGFFRGTSADQDTRFSNKQAKLLKSQKFAPELDHLVDITKVKMDVIRPWIATRATELLGFEDEVLINFVYGLLDSKEVDGKQIQIQLTGFMEKNTGKFMKELWNLLLSAQKNASGVPQQFLDAKEEEMRKKKAESDRITLEIQKKKEKEGREAEHVKHFRMDGEADISKSTHASDPGSKHSLPNASSVKSEEEREMDFRHGRRTKNGYLESPRSSKSPGSKDHSLSPHRNMPSANRTNSKSFSKSRSYSGEEHKSRSVSVSSQSRRHSISAERLYVSQTKRSISPGRRYRSPPRRSISPRRRYSPRNDRSPSRRSRRRSVSRSRRRSPSPFRRRSPYAYRISSSFVRRRSPSPLRRRSPSPSRRRSPVRRRSPSPSRRRSPIRRRSSSPARRRSPSPLRRKSPPRRSPRYRRRSPLHSPRSRATDSQMSQQRRERSRSPYRSRSPLYRTRRSLSRERDSRTNGVESKRYRDEARDKRSPLHPSFDREVADLDSGRKVSDSVSRRLPTSLRSPQRDLRDNRVLVVPPEKSPIRLESVNRARIVNPRKNRRSHSLSESPVKQTRERMPRHDSPETSREEEETIRSREDAHRRTDPFHNKSNDLPANKGLNKFHANDFSPELYSHDRSAENQSPASRARMVNLELRKKDPEQRDMDLAERHLRRVSPSLEGVEYGPGRVRQESSSPVHVHDRHHSTKQHARNASSLEEREYNQQTMKHSSVDGQRVNNEKRPPPKSDEYRDSHSEKQFAPKSKRKADRNDLDMIDSVSEDSETYKHQNMEKRKHKKSSKHKKDVDDGSESESEIEDRKETKRRRKDEKKLRKEERRRRREERHHRRLERRASKLKAKSMDTVAPPSDIENNLNESDGSDGDAAIRKDSLPSDTEEPESEQKKLEIELRKKALESLRAKKAISH